MTESEIFILKKTTMKRRFTCHDTVFKQKMCFLLLQDPKIYVQTTLDVHKKYNALVMTAFNNDAGFVAALDKVSCRFTFDFDFMGER